MNLSKIKIVAKISIIKYNVFFYLLFFWFICFLKHILYKLYNPLIRVRSAVSLRMYDQKETTNLSLEKFYQRTNLNLIFILVKADSFLFPVVYLYQFYLLKFSFLHFIEHTLEVFLLFLSWIQKRNTIFIIISSLTNGITVTIIINLSLLLTRRRIMNSFWIKKLKKRSLRKTRRFVIPKKI